MKDAGMILPMGVYSFDRDRGFTCQLRRSLEVKKKMKILVAALHRCWSWWCTGGELVGSWWCTGGALVGHWCGAGVLLVDCWLVMGGVLECGRS